MASWYQVPGTAGGWKNSMIAPMSRVFSSSSSMTSCTEFVRSDQLRRLIRQVPAFEPRPSVRIS